ncbi:hypothetical protein DCS_07384 [Drechmeria coniospora]|uniref:Uncharacterized protein n=1 Tax=Drechmeria coniospora TaxID=98403 RepID=A0A151GEC7_DRECN|nr:hypothetical protein DCS_07384 [Drechmeria coniospora]KYK55421.1 hypothetical protein DCS_07384 [Drechmeria coniospora]
MSATPGEITSLFQTRLEQYIKPREQVNYVRRIVALHLASCTRDDTGLKPLSLAEHSDNADVYPDIKGVQKEYVEALRANTAARREFDEVLQAARVADESSSPLASRPDLVQEQLSLLKLRKRLGCLLAIQRSLDRVAEKPASHPDFLVGLETSADFQDPPDVPRIVTNRFAIEQASSKLDLQKRLYQLEKAVLRARLFLGQKERLLADARSRSANKPAVVSLGAKIEALHATRSELVSWMEAELSKASTNDTSPIDYAEEKRQEATTDETTIKLKTREVQQRYSQYVDARNQLLEVATREHSQASLPPPTRQTPSPKRTDGGPEPVEYLLTPYLEVLLSVSRQQKAIISQKSHVNAIMGKECKSACQVLSHLAEESQLLPSHPMEDCSKRRSGIRTEMESGSNDGSNISSLVQRWVYAADSAKMATLETVAETIETGQIALENCMNSLQGIDRLLGQDEDAKLDEGDAGSSLEKDGRRGGEETSFRGANKDKEKGRAPMQRPGDPWSRLRGEILT